MYIKCPAPSLAQSRCQLVFNLSVYIKWIFIDFGKGSGFVVEQVGYPPLLFVLSGMEPHLSTVTQPLTFRWITQAVCYLLSFWMKEWPLSLTQGRLWGSGWQSDALGRLPASSRQRGNRLLLPWAAQGAAAEHSRLGYQHCCPGPCWKWPEGRGCVNWICPRDSGTQGIMLKGEQSPKPFKCSRWKPALPNLPCISPRISPHLSGLWLFSVSKKKGFHIGD